MLYIFTRLINLIIGLLNKLPMQEVTIDLSPLTDFLPFLNYFIPFYIIVPIIKVWFASLVGIFVVSKSIGFFKKHL